MTIALRDRKNRIAEAESGIFDVAVVGGGIHGASVARDAALRGYRVLLLEAKDYAFGTSSRSSKLLHGGVRYLEHGNFALVREALRERHYAVRCAPHLGRPLPFLFPTIGKMTRSAWQVNIGLTIYDLLAGAFTGKDDSFLHHEWLPRGCEQAKELRELGLNFNSLFLYFDGQMDDARLVVEAVLDSTDLGAACLNHAALCGARPARDGSWELSWRCDLSGTVHQSCARYLVNAAGPWAPAIHEQFISPWPRRWPTPQYSRGAHLLFDVPWKLPGLILPTGEKNRYYFVLPHFSHCGNHTLVGTTDQLSEHNEQNPAACETEIEELLSFLKRDLPQAGLDRDALYQTFCGMRILAGPSAASLSGKKKRASEFSRSEALLEQGPYLLILGGKYTTARLVAEKTVNRIDAHLRRKPKHTNTASTRIRPFPGGGGWSSKDRDSLEAKLLAALTKNHSSNGHPRLTSEQAAERVSAAISRFGMEAQRFLNGNLHSALIADSEASRVLRCEIRHAILREQAMTVRDVFWRRLGLAYQPGQGEAERQAIIDELTLLTGQPREDFEREDLLTP